MEMSPHQEGMLDLIMLIVVIVSLGIAAILAFHDMQDTGDRKNLEEISRMARRFIPGLLAGAAAAFPSLHNLPRIPWLSSVIALAVIGILSAYVFAGIWGIITKQTPRNIRVYLDRIFMLSLLGLVSWILYRYSVVPLLKGKNPLILWYGMGIGIILSSFIVKQRNKSPNTGH